MVSGLLIHTSATDKGRLALIQMAQNAAASIWNGIGIKQNQTPTRKALATQCRFMCQRLGSWRISPRKCSERMARTFSGVGKYRFMNFFGIGSSACPVGMDDNRLITKVPVFGNGGQGLSKSNHISQSAGKPLLGSAGVLAFSCGVILLYRFAVLPPYRWLFLSLIVLLFVGLLKSVRIPAAVVWLFWTVAGLGWAGWHADGRLQYVLPGEMERVPLTVSGYLCDLPQPGSFSSQRFTLCVHRWHDPPEGIEKNKLPNKIRLAWYGAADKILPSHRLRLQVVLKRPHGSLNDEGFRYEDWLFRQGVRATGSVREDR